MVYPARADDNAVPGVAHQAQQPLPINWGRVAQVAGVIGGVALIVFGAILLLGAVPACVTLSLFGGPLGVSYGLIAGGLALVFGVTLIYCGVMCVACATGDL